MKGHSNPLLRVAVGPALGSPDLENVLLFPVFKITPIDPNLFFIRTPQDRFK